MMNRKTARIRAMEIIFQIEALKDWESPDIEDYIIKRTGILSKDEQVKYIKDLVDAIVSNKETIDDKIKNSGTNFRIERIAKADLAILRIAIGEILFMDDIPKEVSTFEACEMAKEYGGNKSASFVNGVLRGIIG